MDNNMTIAEASAKYGLTCDTLRYYERIGLIPRVPRTSGGIRNYSEDVCKWIEFIKCMRSAGIQIEALTEYVRLFQKGEKTIDARKNILIVQRDMLAERIEEMKKTLKRLNTKIALYDDVVVKCEDNLRK